MRRRRLAILSIVLVILGAVAWLTGWAAVIPAKVAARALEERRFEDATRWAETALLIDPQSAEAEFLLARVSRKEGRLDDLADHLRRAARFGVSRERIHREELLATAQTGDLERIEPDLLKMLVDQQGDGAEVAEAYVNGLMFHGRFDEAEVILDAWERSFPGDPKPHFMRGRAREHARDAEGAEREYLAALKKDEQYYPAAYSLGRIYLSRQRPGEALRHFRRCESMPHNGLAQVGSARALKALGKVEQARSLLMDAVRESPSDTEAAARYLGESNDRLLAAYELGTLETALGHPEEALRWLRKAVEYNERDLDARYALGVALRAAGQREAAQAEFEHVQHVRDVLAATDRLIDGLGQNPENVQARFTVGKTYLEYGSEETGLWWLRSVLQYDPDHAGTHAVLAAYYARKANQDPQFRRLAARHRQFAEPMDSRAETAAGEPGSS